MIFRRWAAFVVDMFITTIPFDIYFQLFKHREADGDYAVKGAVALWVILIPVFLYDVLMEYHYGQTLGKKLLRLKVIKRDGSPITLADGAKRHVFDFIELIILPFIAFFCVIGNNKHRRVGDLLAGTQVVNVGPQTSPKLQ
jgi:uncharacterized RDD family membrane protein YckC